ncbi:MAG: hypothetical protein Kow0026_07320 [Oricola sp.]
MASGSAVSRAAVRRLTIGVVALAAFVVKAGPVFADYRSSERWFNQQTYSARSALQKQLIVTGYYNGFVDAQFGGQTYNAIIQFERENGFVPNGLLSASEIRRLRSLYNELFPLYGFEDVTDPKSGFRGPLARNIFTHLRETEFGTVWSSSDQAITLETQSFYADSITLIELFNYITGNENVSRIEYSKFNNTYRTYLPNKGSPPVFPD